jgi:nucleotide-binding universal stress UspA family protein
VKRFKNILYVLGSEDDDGGALARAAELARANQARLTALAVVEPLPAATLLRGLDLTTDELQTALIEQDAERLGRSIAAVAPDAGVEPVVVTGRLFLEVIRDVLRNGRDLVVKSADPSGVMGRLFGSDDMHLLRKCPCPVWLFKPSAEPRYRRILAAVDVEQLYPAEELKTRHELNVRLLTLAASLAERESAELHVAYVWAAIGEQVMRSGALWSPETKIANYIVAERERHSRALESLLAELRATRATQGDKLPEPIRHLPKGSARSELPDLARRIGADLIVLGTLGRTGVPGLFIGNTAETVLHQADCSVLALKPAGFVSPVA